ncbi:unnamed protein product [Trifolium pratense]|uniref:Uncharacterized protein n=1 Tax=Trifolium pratense TaxID=57577 RepID=A0ACB0M0M0_TRIPR|nr:unnamed protein product [Trifolium pratense]
MKGLSEGQKGGLSAWEQAGAQEWLEVVTEDLEGSSPNRFFWCRLYFQFVRHIFDLFFLVLLLYNIMVANLLRF